MKLNILLVDDEPKVLRGIKTIIDRANENWCVVGECRNGVEALEAIERSRPDVVITDIKMPCMNGLELVEKSRPVAPGLKFIILSGFPDFSYAQQAIRLDTVDYILKPPDYRDILKSLKKVELALQEEEAHKHGKQELDNYKREAMLQKRDRIFLEMLYAAGKDSPRSVEPDQEEIQSFSGKFALLILRLDNFSFFVLDENSSNLEKSVKFKKEVQEAVYKRSGSVVSLYDGTYCCFLNVNNESPVYLKGFARELQEELASEYVEGLTIGVSRVYEGAGRINAAYKECLSILRNKVFFEKNSVIYIDELDTEGSTEDYPLELERKYIEALKFADLDKSLNLLDTFIQKAALISKKESFAFKNLILELIIAVTRGLSEDKALGKLSAFPGKNIYNRFNTLDNINDIKCLLTDYTKSIAEYFYERNKPGCRKIVNDIKAYIQKNYFSDITLRKISNEFFMNESYLSDLFKRETGLSFSSFLTRARMEQAKVLLEQVDLKSFEISEMVGYNNSRYFNKVFKKYTGLSPFEYRERVLNNE